MTNFDFYAKSDAIRKQCDGMTPRQVEDLIGLIRGDLGDRAAGTDTRLSRTDEYRHVADALAQRAEAVYAGRVIHRLGDENPKYRVGCRVCASVTEAIEAIDHVNKVHGPVAPKPGEPQ